jgi:metal-sulfur cluster biosynthetic enzyme
MGSNSVVFKWIRRGTSRKRPGDTQYDPSVLELFRRAEGALRRVEVPGYDVDLVSSGIVKRLRMSRDNKLIVFLDYYGTDPSCYFCRFINQALWNTILSKARRELEQVGITSVVFVDYATGLELEYS